MESKLQANDETPIYQFNGAWICVKATSLILYLKAKYGNKAKEIVNKAGYTMENVGGDHHYEKIVVSPPLIVRGAPLPLTVTTQYYSGRPNGNNPISTFTVVLDGKTQTGPFHGPLNKIVYCTGKYDYINNAIITTYMGGLNATCTRIISNGQMIENFAFGGTDYQKTFDRVSPNEGHFSEPVGGGKGKLLLATNEASVPTKIHGWCDNGAIKGLRVEFKKSGNGSKPIDVGECKGNATKSIDLPTTNVHFTTYTSTKNKVTGHITGIKFGDKTIGRATGKGFVHKNPSFSPLCRGFITKFNDGALTQFASFNQDLTNALNKFNGSWIVFQSKFSNYLIDKHGSIDKAKSAVMEHGYSSLESMDSHHHCEVIEIKELLPPSITTTYYAGKPVNKNYVGKISALLDNRSISGPFHGPLGNLVKVKGKYDENNNQIVIYYIGAKANSIRGFYAQDGLYEIFELNGKTYPPKYYHRVANKSGHFSPPFGNGKGNVLMAIDELSYATQITSWNSSDSIPKIAGLKISFADGSTKSVGDTSGNSTKTVQLPPKNVSFTVYTSTDKPVTGYVCGIKIGNGLIGKAVGKGFSYVNPSMRPLCRGFITVFDGTVLNQFTSFNQ